MKPALVVLLLMALLCPVAGRGVQRPKRTKLFDGKTFTGWEGDTHRTWRIDNGAIIGGSLQETNPQNEFLCTTARYTNFVLRLRFKLTGTGFVNAGVQIRSKRITQPPNEVSGYQADLGEGYWGSLYDESRRNKTLVLPDQKRVAQVLKPNDWNLYEIRCEGRRVRIKLNGLETVDYTEPDEGLEQTGIIGLQVHGGGKSEACYKDITIEELP